MLIPGIPLHEKSQKECGVSTLLLLIHVSYDESVTKIFRMYFWEFGGLINM